MQWGREILPNGAKVAVLDGGLKLSAVSMAPPQGIHESTMRGTVKPLRAESHRPPPPPKPASEAPVANATRMYETKALREVMRRLREANGSTFERVCDP